MGSWKITPWIFSMVLLGLLLLLLEIMVRWAGYLPGDVSPNWFNFRKVDSLIYLDNYCANELGLLVAHPEYHDHGGVCVNSDGFNSPEFTEADSARPTAMLIGDSFTWGMSASCNDSSFAGRLRTHSGWNIHNLGIPATDPVQYALLAEHYIPILRPNVVLVFFFVGNDVMFHDRVAAPYRQMCQNTNAGALLLDIDGQSFSSAQEAYDHLTKDKYYLTGERNQFERCVSHSALLSRLYSLRFRIEEKIRWVHGIKDLSISNGYLMKARDAALMNGAEFRIIVIPELKEAEMDRENYEQQYGSFFHHPELRPHISWPETRKDHFKPYPDAHLNDRGHAVYAAFLLELLEGS
jgi:hypothetical protein